MTTVNPMTPEQKAKAADTAKATARGPVATTGWGAIFWIVLVDNLHWLGDAQGRASIGTYTLVGGIATVWTGLLRLAERRWSWFGTLLLSQGVAQYNPADQSQPTVRVDTPDGTRVEVSPPDPPPAPPAVEPGPRNYTAAGNGVVPALPAGAPPLTPPPYVPPAPVLALDDPESLDTSLVPIALDPDDLLDGGSH